MYTSLVLYFSIFALSMERTRLSFHCWLYNLCIVVYVTNKTWNLKTVLRAQDFWYYKVLSRKIIIVDISTNIQCVISVLFGNKIMLTDLMFKNCIYLGTQIVFKSIK